MDHKCSRRVWTQSESSRKIESYRLGIVSLELRVGTDVSCQADVRNGIGGDKVVQAVGVRVEGRTQLHAERGSECIVYEISPVRFAEVQQSAGECTHGRITQRRLDRPISTKTKINPSVLLKCK